MGKGKVMYMKVVGIGGELAPGKGAPGNQRRVSGKRVLFGGGVKRLLVVVLAAAHHWFRPLFPSIFLPSRSTLFRRL